MTKNQLNNKGGKKAVWAIALMAVIILVAKFMGLFREMLVAQIYGQGYESDVINTATQIPLLFFDMVLGVAILSTFVPMYNKQLEKSGKKAADYFANNFITIIGSIAVLAAVLGVIFAEPLVKLMVPGYADVPGKIEMTARVLRILFPSIAFTAIAYVAVGILQSHGEFTVPSLISVVSNGIMIAYLIIFGDKMGLVGVGVSMLVAWAAQLLFQVPWLIRYGYRYRPVVDFKDGSMKEVLFVALPVLVSSWVQPICNVINMSFGSSMGDGAVSALNWANKIYIIMVGVFAYAITNFILPRLSRLNADDNHEAFAETTRTSVGWIVFIITLVSALFLALSNPIIKVVFQRGQFTAESSQITASALFFYSFGMVGYSICEVLNKSFYAVQDGKTPMLTSIFGVIVNIGCAALFVLVFNIGIQGLALASAISSTAIAAALMIMINRRRGSVITKVFVWNILKTLVCGAAAFVIAWLVYRAVDGILDGGTVITLVKLCIAAIPSCVIYLALAFVLKISEMKTALEFFRLRKAE
ncbi:MAG: murein biosynthesis integral membrane protein MurJ [Clostridiales bacterium]|nr:murein biosynthesis integral membrane protein MurJ [Clostridiales bacterium]